MTCALSPPADEQPPPGTQALPSGPPAGHFLQRGGQQSGSHRQHLLPGHQHAQIRLFNKFCFGFHSFSLLESLYPHCDLGTNRVNLLN